MLSHLRFHRRGPSTPSSPGAGPGTGPEPDHQIQNRNLDQNHHHHYHQHQPTSPLSTTSAQPPPFDKTAPTFPSPGDGQEPSPSSSSLPPTLPPIARVASPELPEPKPAAEIDPEPKPDPEPGDQQQRHVDDMSLQSENRPAHQAQRSPYNNMESGFIGGVALQNYKRDLQAQASGRSDNDDGNGHYPATPSSQDRPAARQRPVPAPINTSTPPRPPPQMLSQPHNCKRASSSFITPTDLQNPTSSQTGRRPAGTKLPSEPSTLPASNSNFEPQKSKKSLPFLKNPMSTLLMRRKNGQNQPDLPPLSTESDEPTYDPRIKGTRVHDFSAPRHKGYPIGSDALPGSFRTGQSVQCEQRPIFPAKSHEDVSATQSQKLRTRASETALSESMSTSTPPRAAAASSSPNSADDSAALKRAATQQRPAVPHRDVSDLSIKSHESTSSRYSTASTAAPSRGTVSTRVARSRNISLSSDISSKDRLSRLPRHMKSTSSRFSFDMIGGTQQEQILEERHRQREAERKVTEDDYPGDPRFDDFDEDAFDYDAMMDDDGLEERIPGVNADYDEEDDYHLEEEVDDPDNDQENFAGFSFQRSNGTSPLASGATGTPQDSEGKATGSPAPKPPQFLQESPLPPGPEQSHGQQATETLPAGLGIQGVGMQGATGSHLDRSEAVGTDRRAISDEDLYYDDGVTGFEDEFAEDLARSPSIDGTPFDESIFDNNDTDQYGRPIAGAFAQAQSERRAAQEASVKRESDMTSRFSTQSEATQSTAHTSLSTGGPPKQKDGTAETKPQGLDTASDSRAPEQGSMAAYQAALAAAAHKAAASGKFKWGSSLSVNEGQGRADDSPTDELDWRPQREENDDDGGSGYENMDDFELDDDAIIAEANASALANDSDGWYGQEFGFYSAPASHHSSHNSGSSSDEAYQYANGGVFGPKGMDGVNRTKSGRMISQEPNLTPITERSEYSNRNSVMSMAMPGHGFGTPIQSPGLAQLAMMADRGGDEMSLSALLRLRSRAWGDSQASQPSSKEGSPKSDRGDAPSSPWASNWGGHANSSNISGRKGSFISGISYESEPGSASGSPTVTLGMSNLTPAETEKGGISAGANMARLSASSQPERLPSSIRRSADHGSELASAVSAASLEERRRSQEAVSPSLVRRRSGPGHQPRNSADSISYTREEESGETRWVMERRRVADSGQVEMEREFVDGGRI